MGESADLQPGGLGSQPYPKGLWKFVSEEGPWSQGWGREVDPLLSREPDATYKCSILMCYVNMSF